MIVRSSSLKSFSMGTGTSRSLSASFSSVQSPVEMMPQPSTIVRAVTISGPIPNASTDSQGLSSSESHHLSRSSLSGATLSLIEEGEERASEVKHDPQDSVDRNAIPSTEAMRPTSFAVQKHTEVAIIAISFAKIT